MPDPQPTSRDIWHIDHVTEACGYFTSKTTVNNGYGCRRCFAFTCPLGYDLTPSQYAQDAKEFRKRGMNPEEFSDGEWMLVRVTTDGRLVGAKERTNV